MVSAQVKSGGQSAEKQVFVATLLRMTAARSGKGK